MAKYVLLVELDYDEDLGWDTLAHDVLHEIYVQTDDKRGRVTGLEGAVAEQVIKAAEDIVTASKASS